MAGKSISYKKNPHYWAKDYPAWCGMFNFERIVVKYYKDPIVTLEAFKAGEFDVLSVHIAKQWHRDMKGRRFNSNLLHQAFAHCARFPTAASRRSLDRVSVPM